MRYYDDLFFHEENGIQNPHCDPFAFIDWFARIRFEKTNWQKEDLQLSKKRLLKIPMTRQWPVSLNEDEFSEDAMVAAAAESAEFHRARTMAHLRGRQQTLALANGSLTRLTTVTLSSASTVAVPQSLPRLVHQPTPDV